jgi:outer membrane immunogenic protein
MKKVLLAAVAGVALMAGAPAHAADLGRRPTYKAPPPVVAPVPFVSWTGCYIGANIGGAWTHEDFSSFDNGSHSASGIAGGGQIGCDYQFASNWLIGIQGMLDGADLTSDHILLDDPDDTFHTKVRWFGTVTGRLGFLVTPSFLIYGKGGVAFVGDNHSLTSTDSSFASTGDFTRTGWDAGIGLEWMFFPSWSVWVEYDHMGFGDRNEIIHDDGDLFIENVEQSVDKVLVGVNYRFGFGKGAPVAARY